ncbi:MAG: 4'-phosphopantetheinyl transferase family protein [Chloroflexota bacterium]
MCAIGDVRWLLDGAFAVLMLLPPDTLHVWLARFDELADAQAAYASWLSGDEIERSARLIDAEARQRFIIARGLLRSVLARYLSMPPAALSFAYGPRGKPAVPGSTLSFNLSHAGDWLLLGVTEQGALGVDIEEMQSMETMATVSRSNFSTAEREALDRLPADLQERGFYLCWTRKEAFIKATGHGFGRRLRDFDVSLHPAEPPRLLRIEGDDPARWSLVHIDPAPGYVGAACVETPHPPEVELFHFAG